MESVAELMLRYRQFFIVLSMIMMIVFAVEVIARVGSKLSAKGKTIFTLIYTGLGGCMALTMIYAFRSPLLAEVKDGGTILPWLIAIASSVLAAALIQQNEKTIK